MNTQPIKSTSSKPQNEPAIDEKQIIDAALEILDEAGFEKLTMRNLAAKLGIKAASLYWHVRNKHDILDLLAEEICAPMKAPDPALPWKEQLKFLGHDYRRVLEAHRDAARVLVASGIPTGTNRLRITEMVLRALLEAGFEHKDAAYIALMMNDFVTMFVLDEHQFVNSDIADNTPDTPESVQNWGEFLSPSDYPSLVALSNYLVQPDPTERFQLGMEILLNGMEAYLKNQRKTHNE